MLIHNNVTAEEYLRLNFATKYDDPDLSKNFTPGGWQFLEQSGDTDDWHGYYGRAFVKGNHIVISSRGSVDLGDAHQYPSYTQKGYNFVADYLINNVHGVFFFQGPLQVSSAEQFYLHINRTYGKEYEISITGFSLGGLLAKALSYKYGLSCVAFDSPGDVEILQNLGIKPSQLANIISIQSSPNIVNTHGTHSVSHFYINVPYGTNSTEALEFATDISSTHNMEKMLMFLPSGLKRTNHWPKLEEAYTNFLFINNIALQEKWKQVKSFLASDHNFLLDIEKSKLFCDKKVDILCRNIKKQCYNASEYCDEFIEFLDQKTTHNMYLRAVLDKYDTITGALSSCYHSITDTFSDLGKSIMNLIGDNNNNEPH